MQERKDMPSTHSSGSFITDTVKQIKKTLHGDVHTMEDVREHLVKARDEDVNFISLLEKHHDYLKESIEVLMDKNVEDSDKQFHLDRFLKLLDMHGIAEQETLYVALKNSTEKEARVDGLGAQDEHDIAFQLSDDLMAMQFDAAWTEDIDAKAKVLAGLVKNHIKEEESDIFAVAKNDIPENQLHELTSPYIDKCLGQLNSTPSRYSGDIGFSHH